MPVIIELPESPRHHHHHHRKHHHHRHRRHSFPARGMATVGPGTVLPTAGVVPAPLTAIASNAHDPYTLPPRPASATPYTTAAVPTYPAYSSGAYNQAGVPTTPYGAPGGMAYGAATVAPTVQYTAPNVAAPSSYNYYPSSAQYAGAYVQPAVATGYGATPRYDRYSPSAGERFAGGMERLVGYRIGDPLVVAHGPQNQMAIAPTANYTTYGNPRGYY